MRSKKEHIHRLLVEKIAGTISEADNEWIVYEIGQDADTKALWDDINRKLCTAAAQAFLNQLDADRSWSNVAPQIGASGPSGKS